MQPFNVTIEPAEGLRIEGRENAAPERLDQVSSDMFDLAMHHGLSQAEAFVPVLVCASGNIITVQTCVPPRLAITLIELALASLKQNPGGWSAEQVRPQ